MDKSFHAFLAKRKACRTSATRFLDRYKYKSRGGAKLHHGRSFRAQGALKGAHASPSLLAHAAGRDHEQIHAPRGFLPSHGFPHNGHLSAQSRAAANTATGQAPDSHRVPFIPPPRISAAKGRMIRCISIYNYFISYSCTTVNISFRKRGTPSGAKHQRGVGAGVSPHPFRKEIK